MRRFYWFLLVFMLVGCAGAEGNVLYEDSFSVGTVGVWQTERDEAGFTAVEDGQLVVGVDAPSTIQFSALQEPLFRDFILEVEGTLQAGNVNDSYGVLFRLQEVGNTGMFSFYRFEVTGDGLYILERHDADGTWTRLTDGWQESALIEQGVGLTNRLGVVAKGGNILIYVNGELLGEFVDSGALLLGGIGLDAGTFGGGGLRVAFDNVLVRKP